MTDNPIPGMRTIFIEAMQTIRAVRTERIGPKAFGNSMPAYVHEMWKDAPPDGTKVVVLPTSESIAVMEALFDLVNECLTEAERKDLYQWGRIQVSKYATIRRYAAKIGLKEHEYRRKIDAIFQKLLVHWNGKRALRLYANVEQARESGQKREKSDVARPRRRGIAAEMAEDGRPQHLPESMDHKRLIRKMLKASSKRAGA